MRTYVIHVDTREKRPLLFPSVISLLSRAHLPQKQVSLQAQIAVVRSELPTGDYMLSRSACLIERKGSLMEVCQNCLTHDRPRFIRAIDRLAEASPRPYLLLETSLTTPPEGLLGFDSLSQILMERRISLLLLRTDTENARRTAGELVARLLIAGLEIPTTHSHADPARRDIVQPTDDARLESVSVQQAG